MIFASDNTGPAHPRVMEAVLRANEGRALPYGNDPVTQAAIAGLRDLFEAPDASVQFVATGTAANALALAALANPWDAIFCHRVAHVEEDECGAPEFYSNAKLTLVDGAAGRMDPQALETAINTCIARGFHGAQPGPVTLTNITELGTAYTLDQIADIVTVARRHGLPVHLDGARFANACAALGCSPADMTWRLGIDAVSFGGTKNGCLGVEAVVMFDPARDREVLLRRKRGGHVWSKTRYLSAQMGAYVTDGLWLDMAQAANARMAELVAGLRSLPDAVIHEQPAANIVFVSLPRAAHQRAFAAGARYGVTGDIDNGAPDDMLRCRLVCDWSFEAADIARALAVWRGEAPVTTDPENRGSQRRSAADA
jgi:threonine aldolase